MKDLKPLKPDLEKEIDKIRKKKHTSINWYDLESEIDRIEDFDTFEEKEVLLYEFQKLFSNQNKSIKKQTLTSAFKIKIYIVKSALRIFLSTILAK